MKRLAISFLALIFLCGCFEDPKPVRAERVDNVVRVFMHKPNREYSFLVKNNETSEITTHYYRVDNGFRIFADASTDEKMWALLNVYRNSNNGSDYKCISEIHIYSEKNMDGGEWSEQRGKRTVTGQTNVVK